MNLFCRLVFTGLMAACAARPGLAAEVVGVTPAVQTDPDGAATIKWTNPNWTKTFTVLNGAAFEARKRQQIDATPGVTVLDFETASGFPSAPFALGPSGGVFTTLEKVDPFNASQKITRISTVTGRSVAVDCRYFDDATGKLFKHPYGGVFLVKDRSENDGMTSGTQGLIAGPIRLAYGDTDRGGVFLTFDEDVADFSVTLNASSTEPYGPSDLIALFDASGKLIAKYSVGVKSFEPVYFGVHAPGGIRSVWIGQRGQVNGLVIDDVAFAGSSGTNDQAALKSQLEVKASPAGRSAPNAYRILFVGDSITRHGTSDAVKKQLGWDHVSGMAASSPDKDYVHLLANRIQATMPDRKVEIYYPGDVTSREADAGGHKSGTAAAAASMLSGSLTITPHLVVVQLGEHEDEAKGEAFLRDNYEKLVTSFDGVTPRPKVIATGLWQPGDAATGLDYYRGGWTGTVESVQRELCEKHGIPFASVREFALDPTCRGWGESGGVKWHPNDKGMQGYASVLFAAFQRLR
jgi:hypothetical protein